MSNNFSRPVFKPGRRSAVSVRSDQLVRSEPLLDGSRLPLALYPAASRVDLIEWCAEHRQELDKLLYQHGGLLLRGFGVSGADAFEALVSSASGDRMLEYTYRSTPRTQVSGKVYTSTEYPPEESIPLHNENAYARSWPLKIWFFCLKKAAQGGQTPIADSRRVFKAIPDEIRSRFIEKGVLYIRNYGQDLDLPWQEVFQTQSRQEVEAFCARSGIECQWRGEDELTTRQCCPAVARHPKTKEMVWFNQAHLFHISSLRQPVRDSLLNLLGEGRLPRNAAFGDGSAIPESDLQEINCVLESEQIIFDWLEGDVLLLENMLTAHGRTPFSGPRRILVAMTDASGSDGLA